MTMTTVYAKVAASADDGWEDSAGTVRTTYGITLDTAGERGYGRMQLSVPQGATIARATLCYSVYNSSYRTPTGTWYAADVNSAAALTGTADEISDMPVTTASVATSGALVNSGYHMLDATKIVQEIVDRAGWASGNYIGIIFQAATGCDLYLGTQDISQQLMLEVTYASDETERWQITDADNDSEWGGSGVDRTNIYFYDTRQNYLRFTDVAIPQYAEIEYAYLELCAFNSSYMEIGAAIHGYTGADSGAAPLPVQSDAEDIDYWGITEAYVEWEQSNLVGSSRNYFGFARSPDIAAVLQEIVNHQDWASGGDLALRTRSLGGSDFRGRSADWNVNCGPQLIVKWSAATPASIPLFYSIDDGNNDASEKTHIGEVEIDTAYNMYCTSVQWPALRFPGVAVPQGATISSAYLRLFYGSTAYQNIDLRIYGEAADNSAAFSLTDYDISDRDRTTAYASWLLLGAYDGTLHRNTPDISSVIEEIVGRGGWVSGNALTLILVGQSSYSSLLRPYELKGERQSPKLVIEYEGGAAGRYKKQPLVIGLRGGVRQGTGAG